MAKHVSSQWSPRWWVATVLVIAALGVLIRLGFWQLDRAEQRRESNQRIRAQVSQPVLDLNMTVSLDDLPEMEYRKVTARGEFLNEEALVLRNQIWEGQPGYHLLVPLRLEGTDEVVLVNRGWIPMEDAQAANLDQYAQTGSVVVQGVIRRSTPPGRFGLIDAPLTPGERRTVWNRATLELIGGQISQPLLPVWIQVVPQPSEIAAPAGQPVAAPLELDLSDGPHLGYALQWFAFAAILAVGYPFYIRRSLRDAERAQSKINREGKTV